MKTTNLIDLIREKIGSLTGPDKRGWYTALCPFHDDHHPSLRFNDKGFRCMACGEKGGLKKLAEKLGIPISQSASPGLTIENLASAKGLSVDFLTSLGVSQGFVGVGSNRRSSVDIPYLNESGEIVAIQKRLSMQGIPRFIWRRGDHPIPYGLWRLGEFRSLGYIIIVEGTSDCWTLWFHQIPALGLPGASTWKAEYADLLRGFAVYLWRENDSGGSTLLQSVSETLPDVRLVFAHEWAKDPSALYLSDSQAFVKTLNLLLESARPASELEAHHQSEEAARLYDRVKSLAEDPLLIERLKQTIKDIGYAGDVRPAMCAYIALTSRLLRKPVNIVFVAQSSSGKNASVEAVLPLFPDEAYFIVRSSSPMVLIYVDDDFRHRMVVVWEADSIPEDGPAASAIRSLMSDQRLEYDVVEKDRSGKFVVRRISKEGPTGIITTSTRPLQEQASTRMLTISISDASEQTREVLRVLAREDDDQDWSGQASMWVDFQKWLSLSEVPGVSVPFARELAERLPADAVRIRRDFTQVLSVIKTFALLHQAQRQQDSRSRVIATLDDYRLARWLLEDVLSTSVSGGASPAIRQTVEAVIKLRASDIPVSLPMLMDHLGLSRSAISYRVNRAIEGGWLINRTKQRGMPAQLEPGMALPDNSLLTDADDLFVCVIPPENHSHTRTPPSKVPFSKLNEDQKVFEAPFEHPFEWSADESPFEHLFEQSLEGDFEAKNGSSKPGVQVFEPNQGDYAHTKEQPACDDPEPWRIDL